MACSVFRYKDGRIRIDKGNISIIMNLDKNGYTVDKASHESKGNPTLVDDILYIPADGLSDYLDYKCEYDYIENSINFVRGNIQTSLPEKYDLREMGRVTSAFLKGLDSLNDNIVLFATTNLYDNLDKAIIRRFDATISFNRYSREDLVEIADSFLSTSLKKSSNFKQDIRLFNKILNNLSEIPYPGDLKQIIKTAVAFSDESNEYDYLRKIYLSFNGNPENVDIQKLKDNGYTTREIEILSRIPKSSVSRKLKVN